MNCRRNTKAHWFKHWNTEYHAENQTSNENKDNREKKIALKTNAHVQTFDSDNNSRLKEKHLKWFTILIMMMETFVFEVIASTENIQLREYQTISGRFIQFTLCSFVYLSWVSFVYIFSVFWVVFSVLSFRWRWLIALHCRPGYAISAQTCDRDRLSYTISILMRSPCFALAFLKQGPNGHFIHVVTHMQNKLRFVLLTLHTVWIPRNNRYNWMGFYIHFNLRFTRLNLIIIYWFFIHNLIVALSSWCFHWLYMNIFRNHISIRIHLGNCFQIISNSNMWFVKKIYHFWLGKNQFQKNKQRKIIIIGRKTNSIEIYSGRHSARVTKSYCDIELELVHKSVFNHERSTYWNKHRSKHFFNGVWISGSSQLLWSTA